MHCQYHIFLILVSTKQNNTTQYNIIITRLGERRNNKQIEERRRQPTHKHAWKKNKNSIKHTHIRLYKTHTDMNTYID